MKSEKQFKIILIDTKKYSFLKNTKEGDIIMEGFYNKDKQLENEIELYLDSLHNTILIFYEGIKDYIENAEENFIKRVETCVQEEREADKHLRNIKYILYRYNLIPDLSADILELMDTCDYIGDISKQLLLDLDTHRPIFRDEFSPLFEKIAKISLESVESIINAVRSYLTQMKSLDEELNKVHFYESEVDNLEYELKKLIYQGDNDLGIGEKLHLTYFISKFTQLSDLSEDIAKALFVFQLKKGI